MQRKNSLMLLASVLVLVTLSCSILTRSASIKVPGDASNEKIPLYPGSETVNIEPSDSSQFITEMLGREYLLYVSNTSISWTEDTGEDVQSKLDEELPENNWRIDKDWIWRDQLAYSEWKKGDMQLFFLINDNLDSERINNLNKKFGIGELKPGSTLIVSHVIDQSEPLPDKTATAQSISIEKTQTSQALKEVGTATAVAQTQAVMATQSAQKTVQANEEVKKQLDELSDDFDSAELADHWEIYRPDPRKWDLTEEPGMLHIVGSDEREAGILNIFGERVTYSDVEVVTRIESHNMSSSGQSAWVAFTPDDYNANNLKYTIELGLAYDRYDGYVIFMWEIDNEGGWVDTIGHIEDLNYQGQVYLKLVRKGKDYTGYYSLDGEEWIFVGEYKDFPLITDQVTLGAGGDISDSFDVYFGYIHYSKPD